MPYVEANAAAAVSSVQHKKCTATQQHRNEQPYDTLFTVSLYSSANAPRSAATGRTRTQQHKRSPNSTPHGLKVFAVMPCPQASGELILWKTQRMIRYAY